MWIKKPIKTSFKRQNKLVTVFVLQLIWELINFDYPTQHHCTISCLFRNSILCRLYFIGIFNRKLGGTLKSRIFKKRLNKCIKSHPSNSAWAIMFSRKYEVPSCSTVTWGFYCYQKKMSLLTLGVNGFAR